MRRSALIQEGAGVVFSGDHAGGAGCGAITQGSADDGDGADDGAGDGPQLQQPGAQALGQRVDGGVGRSASRAGAW